MYVTEHWKPAVSKPISCMKEFIEHMWDLKFSCLWIFQALSSGLWCHCLW
jgi:hypothetical protein